MQQKKGLRDWKMQQKKGSGDWGIRGLEIHQIGWGLTDRCVFKGIGIGKCRKGQGIGNAGGV
jgi:hypothetical protein